jgi:hypothetical protein
MRYRKLRLAWSVLWGVVALLLCVLWVRSYWVSDILIGNEASGPSTHFVLEASGGYLGVSSEGLSLSQIADWRLASRDTVRGVASRIPLRLTHERSGGQEVWATPIWIVLLVVSAIAGVPWLRFRFSLRTLLIATTLVAVVLGLIVWAAR